MTTLAIRKKLAAYIQVADHKKIKAIYELLESDLRLNDILSIQVYDEELEVSDKEISKGDFVSHQDFLKRKPVIKYGPNYKME